MKLLLPLILILSVGGFFPVSASTNLTVSSPPPSLATQIATLQTSIAADQQQITTDISEIQSLQTQLTSENQTVQNLATSLAKVLSLQYTTNDNSSFWQLISSPNINQAFANQLSLMDISSAESHAIIIIKQALAEEKKTEEELNLAKTMSNENVVSLRQSEVTLLILEAEQAAQAAIVKSNPPSPSSSTTSSTTPPNPIPPPIPQTPPGPPTPAGPNLPFTVNTDLAMPSGITLSQIKAFLLGTPLEKDAAYFLTAEQTYNVSAIYLVSDAVLETGWGTSPIYQQKHNLFGFEAYTSDPNAAATFPNDQYCINFVSWYIMVNYLTPPGSLAAPFLATPNTKPSVPTGLYYNGPTLLGMNQDYATDPLWAFKLAIIGDQLQLTN